MKRRFRLTQSADFKRVRRYGNSFAHPLIVLVVLENQMEFSRFGVVAGRTLGKAVKRNRAKRLMRAAINPYIEAIKPGLDIMLIARQSFSQADLTTAQSVLKNLLERAKLLNNLDDDN